MCNEKYNQIWKVEGSHDYSHMLLVMSYHHKPNNIMEFLVPLVINLYLLGRRLTYIHGLGHRISSLLGEVEGRSKVEGGGKKEKEEVIHIEDYHRGG